VDVGRLALRTVIGGLFVGHGTQKLLGAFDGPGLAGTAKMMDSLELRPPRAHAVTVGVCETAGGALLAAGLATPVAAATLTGTMITAIRTVHLKNGPWVSKGGYEYNLVMIAAILGLVDGGPGDFSVDRLLGWQDTGLRWALGAGLLGALASEAVLRLGRQAARRTRSAEASYPAEQRRPEPPRRRPARPATASCPPARCRPAGSRPARAVGRTARRWPPGSPLRG
jgi:putative oxidoreductase